MTPHLIHADRAPSCVSPRPTRDPARQRAIYGPIVPMQTQRKGLLARIFGVT